MIQQVHKAASCKLVNLDQSSAGTDVSICGSYADAVVHGLAVRSTNLARTSECRAVRSGELLANRAVAAPRVCDNDEVRMR